MEQKQDPQRIIRRVILVLLALLVLVGGALAIRIISLRLEAEKGDTVIIPDNLIGETRAPVRRAGIMPLAETAAPTVPREAATISLYKGKPGDNEPFEVRNMLPGDTATRYFCLKVSHGDEVGIYFSADVVDQTNKLGDVLYITVTRLETGEVIYTGPINSMSLDGHGEVLPASDTGETMAYYRVDVTLPTWVGNEHQAMLSMLKADLEWFVRDEGPLKPPVQTGDIIHMVAAAAGISLVMLLLLPYLRSREKEEKNG